MIYRNLLLFSYHSEQVLSIVLGEERSLFPNDSRGLFHIIKISEWILGRGWEIKLLISVARLAKFSLNAKNGEILKALAKF